MEAQRNFGLLTKRKYAYFWTIHNKYLPPVELEYADTVKVIADKFVYNRQLQDRKR